MEPTDQGVINISFKNGDYRSFENFEYYTMQHPFLVIATNSTIHHYNADTIEQFTYTTKETN